VKAKRTATEAEPVFKMPLLTKKDAAEYNRIRDELVKVLERMGGYEPAVDDKYIDRIARLTIYTNKVEMYIDSNNATVDTYVKVTDIKLKQSKMLDMAINQLALARRDRLGKQTESSLMNELREAMLRGMKPTAEQQ
jgi:hypothetical protein